MRLKVIFIIVSLLSMATLPLVISESFSKKEGQKASILNSEQTENSNTEQSTESLQEETEEELSKEKLCGLTAALFREEYSFETLKAIAVILNTDYKVQPQYFDFDDKDICIYKSEADNSLRENYNKIEEAIDEVFEKTLCQNDKAFYIPYSYLSDGTTETDKDFPYIQSVASPWDCYSEEFDAESECAGVSLYGLNYLCNQGYDYSTALKWYLPDFEIK